MDPEDPSTLPKKYKFLTASLKDVFAVCCNCWLLSTSSLEKYDSSLEEYDIDEHEVVISAIRSGAIEKSRKRHFVRTDSSSWMFSPTTGELLLAPKVLHRMDNCDDDEQEHDELEEFLSIRSCSSCYSSALSKEVFVSVKAKFSHCSSLSDLQEIRDFRRRSMFQELLCHCEGWPFGLCKKAILLPPLPKSPSESWCWSKGGRSVKVARVNNLGNGLSSGLQ